MTENRNQSYDYQTAHDELTKDSDNIKSFMNKQRIQYGRNIDNADKRYRQRSQKNVSKAAESYT